LLNHLLVHKIYAMADAVDLWSHELDYPTASSFSNLA
jgi:hypothetical protein